MTNPDMTKCGGCGVLIPDDPDKCAECEDCEVQRLHEEHMEVLYWREVDRRIDEARGK